MTTPLVVDPDVLGGDVLAAMAGHIVGPLLGGVAGDAIVLDDHGAATVATAVRSALVVVVLQQDLAAAPCNVDAKVAGGAAIRLMFAPYSPRGAALAVAVPAQTKAWSVTVTISGVSAAPTVKVRWIDGVLARVLYVIGSEKVRIRTAARAIATSRLLTNATGDTLDRLGAELGVGRFRTALTWDATSHQMAASPTTEADEPYRERLRIYRPIVRPNRPGLDSVLAADVGGLLSASGYRGRITAAESDTDLAIAIRIVSPPNDNQRLAYLAYLRNMFLLPLDATDLPATRPVSLGERARAHALLARLKTEAKWPVGAFVATPIAVAVDRMARCIAALGVTATISITKAQTDAGESRYELGLGIDVTRFDAATLTTLVAAAGARKVTGNPPADIRAVLAALAPQPAASDPDARWLWEACGMRTVHQLATGATFLSHLPMHGAQLTITHGTTALRLDATLAASGDPSPSQNAQLASTIATAAAAAPASAQPWTVTAAAATLTAIAGATPADASLAAVCAAQGLRTPATAGTVAAALTGLAALPVDQWAGLRLDATTATALLAGQPAGATSLADIVGRLRRAGAMSVLPIVAGSNVYLLIGATDLPSAATLSNRRTQWRWLAVPLGADNRIGSLDDTVAASNHYTYAGSGTTSQVAAVIAVTPTRVEPVDLANRIDPYTVAIDAAGQPPLSFLQYEYLMNLVERWCPLGITIDTSRIRAGHVDLNGDGVPDLVDQTLQHSFRPFHGPRRFSTRG
jgi:hypothetical protein